MELVETEEKYVNQLKLLMEKVYSPLLLRTKHGLDRDLSDGYGEIPFQKLEYLKEVEIKLSEVDNIFANLDAVIELNEQFSSSLRVRLDSLTIGSEFADICVKYAPYLKIYVIYLNNYENSVKTLTQLISNNVQFNCFRQFTENTELNGLDI